MVDTRDVAAFISLSSFWALNYPLVKVGLHFEPPLFILLFRVGFGALFSLILLSRNFSIPKDFRTHAYMAGVGMLNVVLFMGLWFTGEETEPASISVIIAYSYPIIAMVLSTIFLSEKPGMYKIIGAAIGFVGMIVVFADQLYFKPGVGLLFLIGAATSWAAGTILFKRKLATKNVFAVNAFQFIYALPFVALWGFLTEPFSIQGFTPQFLLITLYMGSFGSAIAYFIYLHLYRKYDVSSISAFFFLVPAISIVFAYLILGEANTIFTYAGFALISIGIYLTSRNSTRKNRI